MKKSRLFKMSIFMAFLLLFIAGCSSSTTESSERQEASTSESAETETIEVTDKHGTVEVPVNPESVVSLDSRSFETLDNWGIELAAAPKDVVPENVSYATDESVENIGNHREPNLEAIAAADPDLVIVGQRFGSYYEDIKELVPDAAVVDLNFDVSEEAETPGENLINGFKDSTKTLGKIFDKNEEADQLITDFDQTIEDAGAAYNGEDTMMSVVVSGGDIGFAAPGSGRVWGPMYEIFDWQPALDIDDASADHQGDEISVEAIAESNPDWIFVLDRDASVSSSTEAVPAQDVIENSPALQNTTAIQEDQVVYAPADTYTNESIQTYTEIFNSITEALSGE